MRKINIQISEQVWKKLITMKEIGDSFDDVLRRILNLKITGIESK